MSSPIFRRVSMNKKTRPLKIVLLGQNGVGKSAMTVRFLTQRFIGDYDPSLENTYSCTKCIDGENVALEIRDTAVQEEYSKLETNIKWADAFVLVYAVTDRCSFNECSRLKVLISALSKRLKYNGQNGSAYIPAVLVGNQTDKERDRMVTSAEGRSKAEEMNCLGFYEVSVREERDSVFKIFTDIYKHCRKPGRRSELQQRLSCPPVLSKSRELSDSDRASLPLRGRRRALQTIS